MNALMNPLRILVTAFAFMSSILTVSAYAQAPAIKMGQKFEVDGMNCHATSLLAAGVIEHVTYVGRSEIEGILFNYCERLSEPQKGSVGYIAGADLINHSFFVLDSHTRLHKKNGFASSTYKILNGELPRDAAYFKCSSAPLTTDCGSEFTEIVQAINDFDTYYSGLITDLKDAHSRGAVYLQMVDFENRLSQFNGPNVDACQGKLNRLKLRIKSLLDLGAKLNGMGLIYHQKNSPYKYKG